METEKKNNFVAIMSAIIILVLVVVACGFLFFRTDGFTTAKSFYLKVGEEKFDSDTNDFDISLNKEYSFEIVSETDEILNKDTQYIVNVLPNITKETSFCFKVDDEEIKYENIKSLSKGFAIKTLDNGFTIKASDDLPEILQTIYPGKTITQCPSALESDLPFFQLMITNGSESICVNFKLKNNVVIVNLVDGSDEKNHIRFSAEQVSISGKKPATFDIFIDENYYFDYTVETQGLFTIVFDYQKDKVVCHLQLEKNEIIKSEKRIDMIFKTNLSKMVLTPKDVTKDLTQFGHIHFSVESIVLTNTQRSATFEFSVDDDFALWETDISKENFSVKIENNNCTVKLVENYSINGLQEFDLPFEVYYLGGDSILFVNVKDNSDEIVGAGHITFNSADNLLLTNTERTTLFEFQLESGYVIKDVQFDNSICNVIIENNNCIVKLVENYALVENMQFEIIFKVGFERGYSIIISPIDDTYDMTTNNDITFSIENIILTNIQRTATFEFTIPQGYVIQNIEYDQTLLSVNIENNSCNVSLKPNMVLTENIAVDLKFTIEPTLVLTPVDHRDDGHIQFSVEDVILTNTQRTAIFEFTIDEGYILDDYSCLSDGLFTMSVNGNTCTVSLVDDVNLTQIGQYNLLFSVGAYE